MSLVAPWKLAPWNPYLPSPTDLSYYLPSSQCQTFFPPEERFTPLPCSGLFSNVPLQRGLACACPPLKPRSHCSDVGFSPAGPACYPSPSQKESTGIHSVLCACLATVRASGTRSVKICQVVTWKGGQWAVGRCVRGGEDMARGRIPLSSIHQEKKK